MIKKRPQHRTRRSNHDITRHVICVDNAGYEASLEKRKIYRIVTDKNANKENLVRVIDESGEDYLYPAEWFRPIRLTLSIRRALGLTA